MSQIIEVPGHGRVEFPDGMSDAQIVAAIQANSKPSPNPLAEGAKVVGSALYGGLTAIPRFVMEAGDYLESKFPTPDALKIPIPGYEWIAAADRGVRDLLKPESKGAQVAARIGEAGIGAIASPGGLAKPIASGLIGLGAGAGSETSAALFGDNAVTRILGGLVGGGIGGIATAAKTNREALAREALQDVRPQDLAVAVERMKRAKDAGIGINLSQAMPRSSNIDSYIEALSSSKHGRQTAEQLRRQPQQVAFGVENEMAALPGQVRMPQVLANQAQEASETAIRQGMQQATNAWQKFAPKGAVIPEAVIANFDEQLAALAKKYPNTAQAELIEDVRRNLKLAESAPTGGSPIVGPNGQLLNPPTQGPKYLTDALQVKGAIDDVLQNFGARKLNTPGLTGKELRRAQEVRELFRDMIDLEVPALSKANKAYESVMSGVVDPMKKSVVGRVAGRAGSASAVEAPQARLFSVFEKGTVPGATSSEILTLEKAMRQAGQPEVFQDSAKSWLAGKVSKALESADNRMPEDIASKLRTAFGDPRQLDATSKGFEDVLAGMARSQGVKDEAAYIKGFKNFMEIVSDAARRPGTVRGVSSGEVKEMASEGLFRRLGQVSVMTPIRQPALKWAQFLEADALGQMDKLLTSPEGVATLIKLGKQPKYSHGAVTAMATFLGTATSTAGANPPGITGE